MPLICNDRYLKEEHPSVRTDRTCNIRVPLTLGFLFRIAGHGKGEDRGPSNRVVRTLRQRKERKTVSWKLKCLPM